MIQRRSLLATPLALGLASPAIAQAPWPNRPVRVIVGFPPGGSLDVMTRLATEVLSRRFGQNFIVETRSGASGNIGTEAIARATPDGYTIGTISMHNIVINPMLFKTLPYDPERDFAWISAMWDLPNVVAVPAQHVPAQTLQELLEVKIRTEKVAIKDAKLRTFITEDNSRDDLVAHIYDVTYGVIKPTDNLVIIDDSIVRGTTLKMSIIKMMDRLKPKRIVVVSSAPQIRYPDCYGIDMAKLEGLIAFQAALELLKDTNQYHIVESVYKKCKAQENLKDSEVRNFVTEIYAPFHPQEISDKISVLLKDKSVNAEVKIIFQTVENLHIACPKNLGDWYFTGDYPTSGGNRVVNRAFMNFYEGKDARAY